MIGTICAINMKTNMPLLASVAEQVRETLNLDALATAAAEVQETELTFQPHQPAVFFDDGVSVPFRGSDDAKKRLQVKIASLGPEDRLKCLITGPAGSGKTTLAWIAANELRKARVAQGYPRGRFFEILPSQISSKAELDIFMQQLQPFDTVFVDEVHILKHAVGAEPLYHTLADTGNPRYPLGISDGWIDVPKSVSWVMATTEPGELDDTTGGALRRRLSPEIRLDAPGDDALREILQDQGFPVQPDAAEAMVRRSGGLPWQILMMYQTAKEFALFHSAPYIDAFIASEAFKAIGVDEHGLFPEDRRVISSLLRARTPLRTGEIRYRLSEPALLAAAGIDKQTYKQQVQPRLIRLGFLTTTGGQCLTHDAVELFGNVLRESGADPD